MIDIGIVFNGIKKNTISVSKNNFSRWVFFFLKQLPKELLKPNLQHRRLSQEKLTLDFHIYGGFLAIFWTQQASL